LRQAVTEIVAQVSQNAGVTVTQLRDLLSEQTLRGPFESTVALSDPAQASEMNRLKE